MANKLKPFQLDDLKRILRLGNVDPEMFKVAISSAHQCRVYACYQSRKNCVIPLRSGEKPTLHFSIIPPLTEITATALLPELLKENTVVKEILENTSGSNVLQPMLIESNAIHSPMPFSPDSASSKATKSSFTVRLDKKDRDCLQQIATDGDIPISQVLRSAVKFYLKQHATN